MWGLVNYEILGENKIFIKFNFGDVFIFLVKVLCEILLILVFFFWVGELEEDSFVFYFFFI